MLLFANCIIEIGQSLSVLLVEWIYWWHLWSDLHNDFYCTMLCKHDICYGLVSV